MSASNSSLDSSFISDQICVTAMIVVQMAKMVLLLPIFIYILVQAFRQWRSHSFVTPASHSDMFTYHLAIMVLLCALGWTLILIGLSLSITAIITVGSFLAYILFYGETLLHVLTCAERYLAVLHPVTYRGLSGTRGVRIRNLSISCCWLLTVTWSCLTHLYASIMSTTPMLCMIILSFAVISFCSMSVLCVLVRPGPGEEIRDKGHIDQSKQRVFKTVMTITGMLCMGILGNLIPFIGYGLGGQSYVVICTSQIIGLCFNLPSNLILPMLYLHRARKLAYCCANCTKE
ncbi:unnamed protein product [Ophioblennius macclurei]